MEKEDKKALIKILKHQIFLWGVFLIFGSLVILFVFIVLEKAIGFDTMLGFQVFLFFYLCLAAYKLYPFVKEINDGLVDLKEAEITDKRMNTQHLWTGNMAYDASHQPVAKEYFFTIEGNEIQVEKRFYEKFNINDRIKIHSSIRTGKLLRISK